MTPREAILGLVKLGYTETRIAAEVAEALGEPVHQSQINRIKLGRIADPAFSVGAALVSLHDRASRGRKAA